MFQSTPPRGGRLSTANFIEEKSQIALQREASDFGLARRCRVGADSRVAHTSRRFEAVKKSL